MDKMMSWGMAALFLMMPVTLQGITNTWASKIVFLSIWWPRQLAMFIAGSSVSSQALILTFLVIKCFLQTSVVYWRENFFKNLYFKKGSTLRPSLVASLWWVSKKPFHMQVSCPLITKKKKSGKIAFWTVIKKSPKFWTFLQQGAFL